MDRIVWLVVFVLTVGCSQSSENKTRLEKVNEEIEKVKETLVDEEKKALNSDVESQGFMREDYSRFAQELEKSEASEDRVKELEERLERLQEEKKHLEEAPH